MIEIIVLLIMAWAAMRASNRLRKQKELFTEFGASRSIIYLAWLYPLGPALLYAMLIQSGAIFPAVIALLCYVVPLFALKSARQIFERSGTDRTKSIQDEMALLLFIGVGGMVYVVASVTIVLLVGVIAPIG